jgi:pimeloyl-ACP methyl ester carboxylesterase
MTDSPKPRPRLAYHLTEGDGPAILFLPGYASDMTGSKALALEAWAKAAGRAFLRFDYGGCGQSEGAFADQTIADWRDDALLMIDEATTGPVVLVGSSMGGWIMLLAALARPDRVRALVGIAPAPDFTDWGFSTEEKLYLHRHGRLERPNPYGPAPTLYTRALWASGEANRVMGGPIAFDGPVRLLQGQADRDVPWHRAPALAALIRSADVQTVLVKDGDHRLSRDTDIALLIRAVEDVIATL